jgi:hypothetical protein
MLEIIKAEYRGSYRIWIEFNDGASGVVDLENDLWGPMFEPLRNFDMFRRFKVSEVLHTIVWGNDADFAPEFLRDKTIRSSGCLHLP